MTHKAKLRQIDQHLDDLKLRNPRIYGQEERHLDIDEKRLGFEVSTAPIPPNIRRHERSP